MAKLSKHWKWLFTRNDSFHRSFGVIEILTVCVYRYEFRYDVITMQYLVKIVHAHHHYHMIQSLALSSPLPLPLLHIMNKNFAIIDVIIMQTHNLLPFCALPSGPRMNYCFLLMMLLMVVLVDWNASSVLDGKVIWSAASQCFSHRITINDGENMKCNELFLFSLDNTTTTDIQHKDGCLYAPLKCDQRTEKKTL